MEPNSPLAAAGLSRPPSWSVASCALAAGGGAFVFFGTSVRGIVAALFLAVLVVLASIDIAEHRIPNRIVLPSAAIALGAQTLAFPDRAGEWVLSSVGASLGLLFLALVRPGGIGLGDVKLALLLGAVLGHAVIVAIVIAFLAIFPFAVYLLLRDGSAARKQVLPFAPFLALGAAGALLTAGGSA